MRPRPRSRLPLLLLLLAATTSCLAPHTTPKTRFATFNVALARDEAGALHRELEQGLDSARAIAEIIQRVRPDVLLLNEFDYDEELVALRVFLREYLGESQNGADPIHYPHLFVTPVNTGVPSGVDLDGDGRTDGPADAHGYGRHPGQYGMALLSKLPIAANHVRTFQNFRWADMPGHRGPVHPKQRLSSKSHWHVPIRIADARFVHVLASHPTPPVFDGPEDRNGRRNHDEIRFWADYLTPYRSDYIVDDAGRSGGFGFGEFVILGDLNSDPRDGEASDSIRQLLEHSNVRDPMPFSRGGGEAARQGLVNALHRGDPEADTSDFSEDPGPGNLRVDYVLPSWSLDVIDSGVFWPEPGEPYADLVQHSDHRLVWVDVALRR